MQRKYCFLLLATSLLISTTGIRESVAEDGFTPMFNGTDLAGWVLTNTPAETWSFKDDVLFCTGKPIGEIRTAKMYQNFVMELEWRHMVPRGNAGIFVWADDITSRGVPFHRGIEVQVLENDYGNTNSHTTHGDIFPIHGATMTPVNGRGGSRAFPTENRSKPSPEWNHYRIECRDGEISLAVNGKIVTRGKNCVPRKGYICLESEGGVVQYRNVRIRELPATEISPESRCHCESWLPFAVLRFESQRLGHRSQVALESEGLGIGFRCEKRRKRHADFRSGVSRCEFCRRRAFEGNRQQRHH